jgi:hypothetical protein
MRKPGIHRIASPQSPPIASVGAARNVHAPGQIATEALMRTTVSILLLALFLVGCGRQSDSEPRAAKQGRIFDTERSALDKAKTVNDTVMQADQARRAREQADAQ